MRTELTDSRHQPTTIILLNGCSIKLLYKYISVGYEVRMGWRHTRKNGRAVVVDRYAKKFLQLYKTIKELKIFKDKILKRYIINN